MLLDHVADRAEPEPFEQRFLAGRAGVLDTLRQRGRAPQEEWLDERGHPLANGAVGWIGAGVGGRDGGDALGSSLIVIPGEDVPAIWKWGEGARLQMVYAEAVAGQLH